MPTGTGDIDAAILEAARQSVLDDGLERTTMSGVARRAGISRPTLYARYKGLPELTSTLLTEELLGVVSALNPAPETVEDLIAALVSSAEQASASDLLAAVLRTDYSYAYTFTVERLGSAQLRIVTLLEKIIQRIQTSDEVRIGIGSRSSDTPEVSCISTREPRVLALVSYGMVRHIAITATLADKALEGLSTWQEELARSLRGYLVDHDPQHQRVRRT
ncbi:Transcriptional regulator, TetR family [Corynebacterium ciconiae DSM 44920]|uniref:TetR/AcrR family transcriptional regulator n=1 Tax=Corynebacterium ciconiae TaxID=227319 RepID=UPI00035D4128|nr:TetR/AcrR family transcriptional regulator [Corynebacterium ciconiae]WKD60354.1 Transcriptional regulator, TetR family [Corynebacterium ciconiae DSM 44920]